MLLANRWDKSQITVIDFIDGLDNLTTMFILGLKRQTDERRSGVSECIVLCC